MRQRNCRYVHGSILGGGRKCLAGLSHHPVSGFEEAAYAAAAMSYRQLPIGYSLPWRCQAIRRGRSTLGIEVPNRERAFIRLGSLLADERFRKSPSVLTMALGTDIHGEPYYADLATMPHLLVAGATGAGKSVGLQSMITSILYKATRDEVQFIFIDPKRIELGVYADIPHLRSPFSPTGSHRERYRRDLLRQL